MRPKGKPSELEARRLQAVELLKAGKKSSEVAKLLGASASSVKRWKDALRQGGTDALKAKRHPGRTPRLTKAQKAELVLLLACGPRAAGYATDHWTSPQARDVIQRHFGVVFHVGYVWQLLRDLGWGKQSNGVSRDIIPVERPVLCASTVGSEAAELDEENAGETSSGHVFTIPPMHAAPAPAVESSFA